MVAINVNLADIDPGERTFEPLPAGWAIAEITNTENRETRSGTGHYIKVEFTILEHLDADVTFAGRKVWANLNYDNPNPKAVEIAQTDMASIAHAVGKPNASDTEEWHGIPLEIYLTIRDGGGEYSPSNEVKGYRAASAGAQAAPAKPAAKPAKPASATPPWAKK